MNDLIEEEIQARIDFKMNELLKAVKNTCIREWGLSYINNSQKHLHYHEAFSMMERILIKERDLVTPSNEMSKEIKRKKRDLAINKIMERFCKRGDRDYHHKEKLLVDIIKEFQ